MTVTLSNAKDVARHIANGEYLLSVSRKERRAAGCRLSRTEIEAALRMLESIEFDETDTANPTLPR